MGYGFGNVMGEMEKRVAAWELLDTHNAYLGIWIQTGFLGLLLVLLLYIVSLYKGYTYLVFHRQKRDVKEVLVLPLALLSGLFLSGMFEENLSSRGSIQQLIWVLTIVLIYMATKTNKMKSE